MPSLARLKSFFGNSASTAAGFAIGRATSPTIEPLLQELRNETWALYPNIPLDAVIGAEGVAQGQVDKDQAKAWASHSGVGSDVFDALVNIANVGMQLGPAYEAWRRKALSDDDFKTQLKRAALEDQWVAAMEVLKDVLLEPAEIAKAIHRNIMKGEGLLLVEPSSTPGKVPMVPQSPIDPVTEAAGSGMTEERLRILVGNAGLPPGVVQGLELLNRGAITEDDFSRLVGESNMRQEWGDALLALRRRLLTPHEYEEAALRGIISQEAADAGAALSGMEQTDAQLLFNIMGRPLAVHQITTGLARGGQYGGTYTDVPEPYQDAIRRSNIRPEYARLAYANRYSYPSAFVLRTLAQAGELGDAAAVQAILEDIGWPPELAAKVAPSWVGGGGGTDPHVGKAQTQLWTTTHASYKAREITDADARQRLSELGIADAAQTQILALWQSERDLIRKQLSAAQVKKAVQNGVVNPATGAAWTLAEGAAALLALGFDQNDATTLLHE